MNVNSPFADPHLPADRLSGSLSSPAEKESPLIKQYLQIAKRWRWVILGSVTGALALGILITLLMTPKYSASAVIEISRESDRVTNFQGVEREASIADQEFYQTQYGLLSSRSLSESVARELRLVDNPDFFAMFKDVDDEPGFAVRDGKYVAEGRDRRQRVAGEILLDNLAVSPARLSRLVTLRFTSPDAEFSARVANTWAQEFIKSNLDRKVEATAYGRDVLQRQLAEYKSRLDESQRQLVAYASREQIINLPAQSSGSSAVGERSIVSDDLAALNSALNAATADRIEAEALYRQAGSTGASTEALRNQALNGLREKRAELSAEYDRLLIQFEPQYPAAQQLRSQIAELDRSIAREERRVASSYESGYRQALQRERALQQRVESLKGQYLDLRRRSIQYNIYQQEVDTNRALYDGLLQRFKEIGVAAGVGVNNVSIVDAAVPPRKPSSPHTILNLLAAGVFGVLLGFAIALILEQLDDAIEDAADLRKRLGLRLLGTVPAVRYQTPLEALSDRKSELFDAYLAVQTSLNFAGRGGLPRSFSVTSSRPGEGKSTSSLALAATLARSGKKVVLVDGDMRSPSVHQWAGVTYEIGLSDFLIGNDDIPGLVFDMPMLGITGMAAGPLPPNAGELLAGPRLDILIKKLLERFDNVIIDSPPVLGLADAPLIANVVDGVVFCLESHKTRASLAKASLARLEVTGVTILGCVMTKFDPKQAHQDYGYEYGYSYGRDNEPQTS